MNKRTTRTMVPLAALLLVPLAIAGGCQVDIHSDSNTDGTTHYTYKTDVSTVSITAHDVSVQWGVDGQAVHRTLEASVPAAALHGVQARTNYGSIDFVPAEDTSRIAVHADIALGDIRLNQADRKRYIAGFTLKTPVAAGMLRPQAVPPADFPKGMGFGVSYRIAVPPGVDLDGNSRSGGVTAETTRTKGRIVARSGYGPIRIEDGGSVIDAESSSGAVTVSSTAPLQSVSARSGYGAVAVTAQAKTITAKSSSGSVTVTGASQAAQISANSGYGKVTIEDGGGDIEAHSSSGEVTYSGAPAHLQAESGYGAVDAQINDAALLSGADLKSSSGVVHLTLPRSASVQVDAHTSSGHITVSGMPGDVSGGNYQQSFRASQNGGKAPISLHSGYGSISLDVE